jgi:Bacterial SH3 domain
VARAWYLANYEKQLTGSACGPYNCNMAASAMLAQQVSLGAINTAPDELRKLSGTAWECTDNNKLNDGTNIKDAATALARKGVHLTIYDSTDGRTFTMLTSALKEGRFAVVHGDYDQVPRQLRGDKDFLGLHSVFFHEYAAQVALYNGTRGPGIRVGDGLNDGRRAGIPNGYVWWPLKVAENYAVKFPGGGLTYGLMDRRRLEARVNANVRTKPALSGKIIRTAPKGTDFTWGAVQIGQAVGGDRRWYRVWDTSKGVVGFMHASVIRGI